MPRVHVVTHVHWDREWYRPFESFRAMLTELVHAVCDQLDHGAMEHFLLDAQTIAVADHFAIHPDDEDRLRRLVTAGRLDVGPWHVLSDMTLVSGESLIRNLLIGRRWMRRLGGGNPVGYCPDMFGHPPDLPTILRGFDIDTALVWRGAPDLPWFRWRSPAGREVVTVRSRYYEPEVLWDAEGVADRYEQWVDTQRRRDPDGPWLLLNGGDHLAPRDLTPRLAALGSASVTAVDARLTDHIEAIDGRELPVVTGALRRTGRDGAFLLAGTLSTRVELKQANAAAQTVLERWAEPLVVAASGTPDGGTSAAAGLASDEALVGLLDHAWRELLANHPHDSICGCSTDEVHRANLVRYERVNQVAEHLIQRCWRRLGLHTRLPGTMPRDVTHVVVHNPHAHRVTAGVTATLNVAPGRAPIRIDGPDGTIVDWSVEDGGTGQGFETDVGTLPIWPDLQRWRLRFVAADLPPCGWSAYRVTLGDATPIDAATVTRDGQGFVDDGWRVTANEHGSVTLDTPTGNRLVGLGRLVDRGDAGDSYTAQIIGPPIAARLVGSTVVEAASQQRLQLHCSMALPVGLSTDRTDRSDQTVPVGVDIEVVKWRGVDQLEWDIRIDNTVGDHRLRIAFPSGLPSQSFSVDAAFSSAAHPVGSDTPAALTGSGQEQDPGTVPLQRWLSTGVGADRIAVLSTGLHEAAAHHADDGTTELVVTLLRCVGWLGRFDLTSRTMGAGPPIEVPDAQGRQQHRFRLAVRLADDDFSLAAAAEHWRCPPRAVQTYVPALPARRQGLAVDGALVSADKPSAGRSTATWDRILRVWNPTGQAAHVVIALDNPGQMVTDSDLDERQGPRRTVEDGSVTIPLEPFGLHTLRLASERG